MRPPRVETCSKLKSDRYTGTVPVASRVNDFEQVINGCHFVRRSKFVARHDDNDIGKALQS